MITTPYFRNYGRVTFATPVSGSFARPLTRPLFAILATLPLLAIAVPGRLCDLVVDSEACGSHGTDRLGQPIFDYTCDDCMLPGNHIDPEVINNKKGR